MGGELPPIGGWAPLSPGTAPAQAWSRSTLLTWKQTLSDPGLRNVSQGRPSGHAGSTPGQGN